MASESSGLSLRWEMTEQSLCNNPHEVSESCQRYAKRKRLSLLNAEGLFEKGLLMTQRSPVTGCIRQWLRLALWLQILAFRRPWIVRVQMHHLVIDQTSNHQDGKGRKKNHQLLNHLLSDLLH